MNSPERFVRSGAALKRPVLMAILALSWISSNTAWALMEARGVVTPVLLGVFMLNAVFHPAMFLAAWRRWLAPHVIDAACLCFAAGVCGLCMALRLYAPVWGAAIDIQPLYLWIPVIYVFVFTLAGHVSSLRWSLMIMATFVAISAPFVVTHLGDPIANFTIQLHMLSAVLISALYFFSSYQHRFQIAQLTVDELARLANTDDLTRLANRRRMTEAMTYELVRFARYGHAFSIILFDIDHFKAVNDGFGHSRGDEALKALAARTQEVLRDVDRLGRWGGEEFIVILPETGFDETLQKAEALCRHVAAQPLAGDHAITISCGVASVAAGDDVGSLLQRADDALYAAKRQGRNRAEGTANPPGVAPLRRAAA